VSLYTIDNTSQKVDIKTLATLLAVSYQPQQLSTIEKVPILGYMLYTSQYCVIQQHVLYHDTVHVCIAIFQFHCFTTHGSMTE